MCDISIIVPVYNTPAEMLHECVGSVLAQQGPSFEVILIDDGSDAATARLIDSFAEADERVRVIHTPNRGLSCARNAGLDVAKGEYIVFVDSDDMIVDGSLEYLLCEAKQSGCKMVIAGQSYRKIDKLRPSRAKILAGKEVLEICLYQRGITPSAGARIFHRSVFDSLRFTPGRYYEDLDLIDRLLLQCDKVAVSDTPVYFYRQHPDSFLHKWSARRLDALRATEGLENRLSTVSPDLLRAARDRRLSANFNIFLLASANRVPEVAAECWNVVRKYRSDSLSNPKVRIKNKLGILLSYAGPGIFKTVARCLGM